MKRLSTILLLGSLAACHSHAHDGDDDHGHGAEAADERPALSFTDWTDTSELFIELPALVVGEASPCAAHVTNLDGFAALAGPASVRLYTGGTGLSDPNLGAAPCRPTQPRPYLGLVGGRDATLQTTGNWSQPYWSVNPTLAATPGFVDPNLVNEEFFHRQIRVPLTCGGTAAAPTPSSDGKRTAWSDCGGRIQLIRAETADHCLGQTSLCTATLPGSSGLSMRDLMLDFFTSTEPR